MDWEIRPKSHHAWIYVLSVLLLGTILIGRALPLSAPSFSQWSTFAVLTILAILPQLVKIFGPNQNVGQAKLVALFAGIFLLPLSLFVLLVIIPHLWEWAQVRLVKTSSPRSWYVQPFNIATHIIAGIAAHWIAVEWRPAMTTLGAPASLWTAIVAIVVYLIIDELLTVAVLVLTQGNSWQKSGILDAENLLSDAALLCLGYILTVLWSLTPWLLPLALAPLVLIYWAKTIPQLRKDAETDAKTGLYNARYLSRSLTSELQRSRRLDQPISVVMADLDLLRTVNNTYGHLAGDAALEMVGRVIRHTLGNCGIAGRFGGEEFLIILPAMDSAEAERMAERVRQAVGATGISVSTNPLPLHVSMSLGVASFPADAATSKDLIHEADLAVYQAKLRGRNCVVCAPDVPRSVKLESILNADPPQSASQEFLANQPGTKEVGPPTHTEPSAYDNNPPDMATASAGHHPLRVRLFVGGVTIAGIVATVLGFVFNAPPAWTAIGLLTLLAAFTEYYEMELYGDASVSVSAGIVFAAAIVGGIPGAAMVEVPCTLIHYLRRRPALFQSFFSWAIHPLAALAPVLLIRVPGVSLTISNLPLLAFLTVIAALIYFGIESGLIATAISLSEGRRWADIWVEDFRWLAFYYVVLCLMGMFLSIAYLALSLLGIIVFVFPIVMMRYAQKQYVDRTEEGVKELKRLNQELTLANCEVVSASRAIRQLNEELFMTLAKVIDARDPFSAGHAATVADYAAAIAAQLGLAVERQESVRQAALLHDIGKLGIPESILFKPGRLTDDEYARIKAHAALGGEFLEASHGLRHLAPLVAHHHERWDGRGYPDGLQGDGIPLEARILAVCDAVEAMASDRPYHQAISLDEIVTELRLGAGTQFDPAVVQAFVSVVEQKGERYIINSAQEVAKHQVGRPESVHDAAPWMMLQPDDSDLLASP